MNILYIHGFGGRFDPESAKNVILEELGTVYGVDLDYTKPFGTYKNIVREAIAEHQIDLVVGTSMGGYMASWADRSVPFVAINPAIDPATSLKEYLGTHEDWNGKPYTLTEDVIRDLRPFRKVAPGLILLAEGDEVIDANETRTQLQEDYRVIMYRGGTHRFTEHMESAIPVIEQFYYETIKEKGLRAE